MNNARTWLWVVVCFAAFASSVAGGEEGRPGSDGALARARTAVRLAEERGEDAGVGELLRVIRLQQDCIDEMQRRIAYLSEGGDGEFGLRLRVLEQEIEEMNDPYTFESPANKVEGLRSELGDLGNRVREIEAALRTIRIYGMP